VETRIHILKLARRLSLGERDKNTELKTRGREHLFSKFCFFQEKKHMHNPTTICSHSLPPKSNPGRNPAAGRCVTGCLAPGRAQRGRPATSGPRHGLPPLGSWEIPGMTPASCRGANPLIQLHVTLEN